MKILTQMIKCKLIMHLLLLLYFLLTNFSYATTLDRRPRGKGVYNENLKNRDFPFTFMVNEFGVDSTIKFFKSEIQNKNKSKDLLKFIFDRYNEIPSVETFHIETVHKRSLKAKLAAFIYMMGLMYDSSNRLHASIMPDSLRNYYAKRAYDGLTHLNPQVQNCYAGIDCGKVRQQAMNLIQYLQAYDYLKTGGYIQPLDGDMNKDFNFRTNEVVFLSPRNCLRGFARNLYKSSDMVINSKTGWKKNHGIISCSAIGVASFVLGSNAGGKRDKYDPNKWFQRAHGREHSAI
jgi:hypothetical protein